MMVTWVHDPPLTKLPEGFMYVGQDCYYLVSQTDAHQLNSPKYLYSDSATSCIILILEGTGHDNQAQWIMTHLSCSERFLAFFDLADRLFSGPVSLFALGANPPSAEPSKRNRRTLLEWIQAHRHSQQFRSRDHADWYIDQVTLALGLRVPQKERNGCAGIDLQTSTVSTQSYTLTDQQRDPNGGIQTLFSIFGLSTNPPMALHNVAESFRENQIRQLVEQAERVHWTAILEMTDAQILASCSSTPDDEVPWFCETLRASAGYVKNYVKRET